MHSQKTYEENNIDLPVEHTPVKVRIQSDQLSIYNMEGVVVNAFMTHDEVQEVVSNELDFSRIQFKMLTYSLEQAQKNEEDIVLITDQEDIKMGLTARKYLKGKLQFLTIHQISLLLLAQLLEQKSQDSGKEKLFIRSVNISEALDYVCAKNEIKCIEVFTGSENLQKAIQDNQDKYDVMMAVDEFNHILFPDSDPYKSVNDAFKILLTKAVQLKKQKETLIDELVAIYKQYRFYHEKSFIVDGGNSESYQNHIATIMGKLRKNLPDRIHNYPVRTIIDYKRSVSHNIMTGKIMKIDLPKADILQFITVQGDKISIASSEDYTKLHYNLSMSSNFTDKDDFDQTKSSLSEKMVTIIQNFGKF